MTDMNALPFISHRMFVAAVGGSEAGEGHAPARRAPAVIDLRDETSLIAEPSRDYVPFAAMMAVHQAADAVRV
jgi:hypothetical protein